MISRRTLLKAGGALAAATGLRPSWSVAAQPAGEARQLPVPTPAQQVWQDCEVGVIFHFDMPIAAGRFASNNATRETFDPGLYNPSQLDTDQWIEAAKAAGACYAIFTATHFNGFMQWPSDLYPYGVKQAAWRGGKGDVVGDFVASCRAAGIKPGIYFSTHRNAYWKVWGHYVDWGQGKDTPAQAAFNRIAEKMTEELCSRYGQLVQIWFDAGVKLPHEGGPDVLPIFERLQPNSVFYNSSRRSDHRWIGNEKGYAGYPCWATMPGRGAVSHNAPDWRSLLSQGDSEGTVWSPGMVDVPLRNHNWFWRPDEDHKVYSADALVKMYYDSVGRNCNLIIGEVINRQGLVPEGDLRRLGEFGREIERRFRRPLAQATGEGHLVELTLDKPVTLDHVVIMEDIAHGERVRAYEVEGLMPGGQWRRLCAGESVGHKRIEQFPPTESAKIRFRATKAVAAPRIRSLAAYCAG